MAKTFAGARLRRLRAERGLTQVALARALELSASYVNQLENDQRPITVPVLLALTERFHLPAQYFSADSDARLAADLRDVFTAIGGAHANGAQIEGLAVRMPEVDLLGRRFEVGVETVCHRLSTLQRPRRCGIPFIFVRTDEAGNISERQSATGFHFSRVGGSCPLWVVHDAFAQPGRIITQVAQMPDGRKYFWIATTTPPEGGGYLGQHKSFAIGLGCNLAHADKLVYSTGIALNDPTTVVPIGAGCKICNREACPQRAFPYLGRRVVVDAKSSSGLPYPAMT